MATRERLIELGLEPASAEVDVVEPDAGSAESDLGARVAQFRRASGLTGDELGAKLGLRKDQISKIESGKRRIDVGELPRLADALGVSVRTLLGQPERPAMAMAARLAPGVGVEATRSARRRARQILEADDLLTQVTGMPAASASEAGRTVLVLIREQFQAAPRTTAAANEHGREMAGMVRSALDLGSSPIGDLPALLESNFATHLVLAPLGGEADGLCIHHGTSALIMASTSFPLGHVRFTLAHELAHHLVGDPREIIEEGARDMFSSSLVERRANSFAAHLLMPEKGMRGYLEWLEERSGAITDRALLQLMVHFNTSLSATANQLWTIGFLARDAANEIIDSVRVHDLVARHPDVAGAWDGAAPANTSRAPDRLVRQALAAARARQLGLSVVAALLDRADDDDLWNEVMEPQGGSAHKMFSAADT